MSTTPTEESKSLNNHHLMEINDVPPNTPNVKSFPEEIPLQLQSSNESNLTQENNRERIKLLKIFSKYDRNRDGFLNITELKEMIKNGSCNDFNRGLSKFILKMDNSNGDEQLNFEEFYELYQQTKFSLQKFFNKQLPRFIPSPNLYYGDEVDGAYEDEMKFCPPPLGMIIITIMEIFTYFYDIFFSNTNESNDINDFDNTNGPAATLFIYNPYKRKECFRFITYMFVHQNKFHLIFNLVIQILLGVPLEVIHNWWRVILIYLAGVVAGSIGTSIFDPTTFLAGASGGVYALYTAHIATIVLNFREMGKYAIIQLFIFVSYCAVDIYNSVESHINGSNDGIGYISHLSGALAGFLVGLGVLRNIEIHRCEKILCYLGRLIYIAFIITAIAIHVFYPNLFPPQDN